MKLSKKIIQRPIKIINTDRDVLNHVPSKELKSDINRSIAPINVSQKQVDDRSYKIAELNHLITLHLKLSHWTRRGSFTRSFNGFQIS